MEFIKGFFLYASGMASMYVFNLIFTAIDVTKFRMRNHFPHNARNQQIISGNEGDDTINYVNINLPGNEQRNKDKRQN